MDPQALQLAVGAASGLRRRRHFLAGAAASVLVVSGLAVKIAVDVPASFGKAIATEVAMSHLKREALTVAGVTIDELSDGLPRLGFRLRAPSGAWTTVGARYCSIDGDLAAQVRLAPEAGGGSLFVVRLQPRFERVGKGETMVHGVRVRYWSEGGLFWAHVTGAG
jgi:hypothetical protein